jgi:hypothetical protein
VNLARVRLLADEPNAYRLHDGNAEFRVPKTGLSDSMHKRIKALETGLPKGRLTDVMHSRTPMELPDERQVRLRKEAAATEARNQAEYEEETGDSNPRPVKLARPPQEPGLFERAKSAAQGFASQLMPAPAAAEPPRQARAFIARPDGTLVPIPLEQATIAPSAPLPSPQPSMAVPGAVTPERGDEDLRALEVQRARGGRIPGYAEGGGIDAPFERRDAGSIVYVPSEGGGLVPIPMSQFVGPMPQQAPPPASAAQPPSPDALAAVRGIYAQTGPAGAAALGRMADDPLAGGDAVTDLQRTEQGKLTSLQPREEAPLYGPPVPPAQPAAPAAPPPGGGVPRGAPFESGMGDALKAEQAAIEGRGKAEAQQAFETETALYDARTGMLAAQLQQKDMAARARERSSELMGRYQQSLDEMRSIDARVDPGRFWASRSTLDKVIGTIGLALGAVGAGKDGVNRASELLTRAVDRDIDAQKAEVALRLQKGQQAMQGATTMFGMNQQLFQDDIAAAAAAKATALELADNQLKQVAARYASPIAKNNAAVLSAQLQGAKTKFETDLKLRLEELAIKRQANAIDAAKAANAGGPGSDKQALHTAQQVREKAADIRANISKARALIKATGTFELLGPNQADLGNALSSIATDMAKLKDPDSAARPGEVEQEIKNIGFDAGDLTTRNETARELLNRYLRAVDAREQEALRVRGFIK